MNKLNSFFKLSNTRKKLLLISLILTIIIRISIYIFSFSNINKISNRLSAPNNQKDTINIQDIIWSVKVASNYIPKATCLTQAITAKIILSRYNIQSHLKIGVMKKDKFEAHAWLEINNKIILGESEQKFELILNSDNQ